MVHWLMVDLGTPDVLGGEDLVAAQQFQRAIGITSLVQVRKAIVEIYVTGIFVYLTKEVMISVYDRHLPSTKTREGFHDRIGVIPTKSDVRWFRTTTGPPTLSGFSCLSRTCLIAFAKHRLMTFSRRSASTGHSRSNLIGFCK